MSQLELFNEGEGEEGRDRDRDRAIRSQARHMIRERRTFEEERDARADLVAYGATVDEEHGRLVARDLVRGASAFDDIIKDLRRGRYDVGLVLHLLEEAGPGPGARGLLSELVISDCRERLAEFEHDPVYTCPRCAQPMTGACQCAPCGECGELPLDCACPIATGTPVQLHDGQHRQMTPFIGLVADAAPYNGSGGYRYRVAVHQDEWNARAGRATDQIETVNAYDDEVRVIGPAPADPFDAFDTFYESGAWVAFPTWGDGS